MEMLSSCISRPPTPALPHEGGGCHCERSEAISFPSTLPVLGKELSAWRQTGSEGLLPKLPRKLNSFWDYVAVR